MENIRSAILTYNPANSPEIFTAFNELVNTRKYYIETYGCQMNLADTRIIMSVLNDNFYQLTENIDEADIILLNTCAIRENAVQRVLKRLREIKSFKKKKPELIIGIVGCIAEHAKEILFENEPALDLIAGPDSYRHLGNLIELSRKGNRTIDTALDSGEKYENITPFYYNNEISSFVTITRGCNNFCSYCIVPAARGNERSRDINSIIHEVETLSGKGFKEITLLGQNVNSYLWHQPDGNSINFAKLLKTVAAVDKNIRIRFATSHPKDINKDIILSMSGHENICKHIHLALQSGSNRILKLMNRNYTPESFIEKVNLARNIIHGLSITTDIIAGFCTETEEDHAATLEIMEKIRFDHAYMFSYSERKGTYAAGHLTDDVDEITKKRRLNEIIKLQNKHSMISNKNDLGKVFGILVEGSSKRSDEMQRGRNSQNKMAVFPAGNFKTGDYINVKVENCTSATLIGIIV